MEMNSSSFDQCYFMGTKADFTKEFYTAYIATIVINALICLPTILGNLLIILGVSLNPSLYTPSNVLLVGLACTDCGVGLIVSFLNIGRIIPKLQGKGFGSWCSTQIAYTFFGVLFCGVSFSIVASFAADRYLALHWHLRYTTIVTTKRVIYLVLSFWLIFGAMSTVQIWSMIVYRISVCIVVPIFLVGTSFTYFRVYRVLHRHKVQIQSQSQATEEQHRNEGTVNMAKYRKSLTSMFLVYCMFLLCYSPYICVQIMILITSLGKEDGTEQDTRKYSILYVAVDVTETIVILNSFLNPFIYCWRMRDIRRAAKRALLIAACNT